MRSRGIALAVGLVLAVACAAGCVRKWPVYYAPVWSADGAKLFYVVARPDGALALREADVAGRTGSEIGMGRFAAPPAAIALSPQGDKAACAIVAREKGAGPALRLHIISPGEKADRVAWEAPCKGGTVELSWAPDGSFVVAAAERAGGWGLYRVPVAGGPAQALVADLAEARAPAVSPDGHRVAFVARAKPGEPYALHVAALDGGARRAVAAAVFREFAVGYGPAWSPKGDVLAYVAERYLCRGFAEIHLWTPGTGESRPLARGRIGACLAPAWSPRGDTIAFVSLPWAMPAGGPGTGGQPADILLADTAGKMTLTLAADGLANLMPSWSPDGQQVAFNTCGEPSLTPHVVRIVPLGGEPPRPAEDGPESAFLLAAARGMRAGPVAAGGPPALAARVKDPAMSAFASGVVADLCAARGDWATAAEQARRAAGAATLDAQLRALMLLAKAQMFLGDPKGAIATLDLALSKRPDEAARALRQRLAKGLETLAALEAELRATAAPVLYQAIADTYLHELGSPRKALEVLFRLAHEHPQGPHIRPAAASVFAACEQLGANAASYRVLEWAAKAMGEDTLTASQLALLAATAAANADANAAVRWLERLAKLQCSGGVAERGARAALSAGDQFAAQNAETEALAAYQRALAFGHGQATALASLEAGKLLFRRGEHWAASRLLLDALGPQSTVPARREALRLLVAGRIQRRDPLAYDVAEVGELVAEAFLEQALKRGEELFGGLAASDPRREALRRDMAAACSPLADWHLARGDAPAALGVVQRWLRWARRDDDLPRALIRFAACQKLAGDAKAHVEALARLAQEFPDRPEGAEARRELLLIDTARPKPGSGQ